ncbi:MAG: response regulator transcription factor [Proteobacteria bacterium]|nr:response regulator transcription factor [Pseudomonadota bacterium]
MTKPLRRLLTQASGERFSIPASRKLFQRRISRLGSDEYGLSPREVRILTLICFRESIEQAARKLRIAPSTVSTHLRSIFEKMRIHSKANLISKTLLDVLREEIPTGK